MHKADQPLAHGSPSLEVWNRSMEPFVSYVMQWYIMELDCAT